MYNMGNCPNLIVMLTHNDQTVENAYDFFQRCKNSKVTYWGMKEKGISIEEMKRLCSFMKECGKTTVLEVVAYTESECINAARVAAECEFDILMGTLFFDSVNELCKIHNIKYMPFVGKVDKRPSVLEGSVEDMINEAESYIKKGAFGVDLLAYRYKGDAQKLIEEFMSRVKIPVCIAGSINSYERIECVKNAGAWSLTIGGAFFENKFEGDFNQQVDKIFDWIKVEK